MDFWITNMPEFPLGTFFILLIVCALYTKLQCDTIRPDISESQHNSKWKLGTGS